MSTARRGPTTTNEELPVVTEAQLAKRVGTLRAARALLRHLEVPVHGGVFSERLFLARLEGRADPRATPFDRAVAAIAKHGFMLIDAHRGKRVRLRLKAMEEVEVGLREFDRGELSPYAPFVARRGEIYSAALHMCTARNTAQTAPFNLRGFGDQDAPPLYFLFLVEESRLFVEQRDELRELRAACDRGESNAMFSAWRDGLRINLRRGPTDLDADYRIRLAGAT